MTIEELYYQMYVVLFQEAMWEAAILTPVVCGMALGASVLLYRWVERSVK